MLTTVIGAFPKPSYLKVTDWFNAKKSEKEYPTKFYNDELKILGDKAEELFDKATKDVINDQAECGIDIITDGEVRRENYVHYHCRHLKGIDFSNLTEKLARSGSYKSWLPTIVSKIEAGNSFLVNEWKKNQSFSKSPIKITIPGPLTITDTIANIFYKSEEELGHDLAKAINVEVKRLVDAGCKYIQIDEPLFARKPKEALEYGIKNLEKCFEGIDGSKTERIMHMCCGYPDKIDAIDYPKAPLETYKKISKKLDNSIIDVISIEDAHRYNDEDLFKNFLNTKLILGVIKIASSKIETEDEIEDRIKNILKYIDKERLIIAPDCGLGYLSRELAKKKLSVMTNVAKKF